MESHMKLQPDSHSRGARLLGVLTAALLLVAGALAPVVAETTDEPAFTDTVDVNEVLVDVVVTDKRGTPVLGLGPDDFIVRENGEPRPIVSAQFYSNREFLGSSEVARELGITPGTVPENRYFILFFHNQRHLLPRLQANMLDAGRRAEQWVKSSLQPNDYVAIASYFPKLNVSDFTNDPDLLAETIRLAVQGKDFVKRGNVPADVPSLTEAMPPGDADNIYEALALVAEGSKAIRGRKNLVLYSIGFGQLESFGFYRPDPLYYPEMIQTLNDNRVAVYPVDLLATDVSPFFNRLNDVLNRIAVETGGELYTNFVSYLTPLEQIAEDNNGYYLLSYQPGDDVAEGEYQKVEVETLNSNLRLRTREGYVPGDGYAYASAPNSKEARSR